MALSLLDGTSAAIDISIATNSYKCVFNYWSADIGREFTEATTFCSSGWRARTPGMKQLTGRAEGFASKGSAIGDPSTFFSSQAGVAIVLTADTGCTFTFTGHVSRAHVGVRAASNSEFAIDFESTGSVTTAWVIA